MDQTPATSAAENATAPAPAVEASTESTRKPGFLARLLGNESRLSEVESTLATEQAAHAATRTERDALQARVAEFEALEAQLEAEANAAAAAAAQVPQQVAAGVADVVAALGIPEATLPAQAASNTAGPVSLAEFHAMSPAARMEFIRNGGKLTD
jgi:hypothetical protein